MKHVSSIISCSIGNILEWYDFGLFTLFSPLFSKLFFPQTNPQTALLATISIFSIGFFCRPIGALIFGYFGDKKGRAKTLKLSILMIVMPTLIIGFIPTYTSIGIFAPILLTITRMWQGISIGGEYSGSAIYLAETAPNKLRATFTSLASMGANLGIFLAALVGILTTNLIPNELIEHWGWRIPYILSGLICILIYMFRLNIQETTIFTQLKSSHNLEMHPIKTVFTKNSKSLLKIIGLVCMGSAFYFFCFIYLPIYLKQTLHYSVNNISLTLLSLILLMISITPIAGFICDKIGRRKMLIFNACVIAIIIIPGFYFINFHYKEYVLLVMMIFTLASSFEQGTTPITIIENFPAKTRYTGVSLGYNIGNGLLGGLTPLICDWLFQHAMSPAYFIAICAVVTGLVAYYFVPESAGKSLTV